MAELIKDTVLRILPLTREDCEEMISSLKMALLIEGFRGSPPLAKDLLVNLILKLSSLVTAETWIEELDFYPLFLFEDRVVIGDVRVIRRQASCLKNRPARVSRPVNIDFSPFSSLFSGPVFPWRSAEFFSFSPTCLYPFLFPW